MEKIDSLKSPIKRKLLDLFKSRKYAKIKSYLDSIPPSDPNIRLTQDITTWIEIKQISHELEQMNKRGEIE